MDSSVFAIMCLEITPVVLSAASAAASTAALTLSTVPLNLMRTISGTGRFLKSKNPDIKVVAVEPSDSPYLSKGQGGAHKLQGIGAGFVPDVLDTDVYDEIITVTSDEAYDAGRSLAKKEGILVGISSGAALFAAIEVANRPENEGKTVVVLLPDTGDRYLSTEMFTED